MRLSFIRRASAVEGFTLVELLVAITLISILMAALFSGLRFGMRATNAVAAQTDRFSDIALLYDFMQNELSDARLLPGAGDGPMPPSSFEGQPESLSFVTIPPAYLALGGFHLIHVGTEGDARKRRLIVSWQQVTRGAVTSEPTTLHPSLLLDRLTSIRFSYFGVAAVNRPPGWLDRWTGRLELPQLVRLRVVLADGWQAPDLVVAPRLAGLRQ